MAGARAALLALTLFGGAAQHRALAADIDIYGSPGTAGATPNVLFLLDNTSNWSSNNQNWNSTDSWSRCKDLTDASAMARCQDVIKQIYYTGTDAGKKPPWESADRKDVVELTQGQVQLRSLKMVLNELVCSGKAGALGVNVGLAMLGKGSVLGASHSTAFIRFAVQRLSTTAGTSGISTCKALIDDLDNIDGKITQPDFKAPSNANYGAALFEVFKYFGGYTNPTLAAASPITAGSPRSRSAYGRGRYSSANPLADPNAFESATSTNYKALITAANACANNYVVLVGNDYPNSESPGGGDPAVFKGLDFTPPALSAETSDPDRFADEWSYFLANTDVSEVAGVQRVLTYAVNTYKDKPDAKQAKLLRSMAAVGGVGPAGYIEVGGDLVALVDSFREIVINVAAVDSVFTATTLPVSTTTQGTFLNQVFVGMFRPDADGSPRWIGNLKQYQLDFVGDNLELVDAKGKTAVTTTGFFSPLAESFWTAPSVYFAASPSGSPPSASDLPDGPIVEKGGAAQMLRTDNLTSSANRKVLTLTSATGGSVMAPFSTATAAVTKQFSTDEINWIRGEANVTSGPGAEALVGSRQDGNKIVLLDTKGARHSIHGDVLHSRPVAVNYGSDGVVVFYGSNDGLFRAVDGSKTGTTAGHELWSFIAPEHYGLLKRQRAGTPLLHLPQTDSAGQPTTAPGNTLPKDYMMDGPIGVYTRYNASATSVTEAFIYPTMRRGGRTVYAFDVKSKTDPAYMWKITGGSGDYAKLAQTWSMPKPVVFSAASGPPPVVLFMGGGYDPAEDNQIASSATDIPASDRIGNLVYVINGRTGERIAAFATDYSVPADVAIADVNFDGVPDRAYVVDVRANVYRIDFPAAGNDVLAPSSWSGISAVKVFSSAAGKAALQGKVFFAPDIVATKDFVAVLFGTGDREKPLMTATSDNFLLVKDTVGGASTTPLTKDDLTRIARIDNSTMKATDVVAPSVAAKGGCYIQLATNGEKVVNAPFTIAGVTTFGTNRPRASSSTTCFADQGEAFSYRFPLFCGEPSVLKLNFSGLPPSPVGGFVELVVSGKKTVVPFLIGGGGSGSGAASPFSANRPKPTTAPRRTRLNWHIENRNR